MPLRCWRSLPASMGCAMAAKTRRSTALPKDFVVRHNIPDGMRVSLGGLERLAVQFFGGDMKRRAGIDVWDEEAWKRRLDERAASPAAD